MGSPQRQPRGPQPHTPEQKIQALLPALNLSLRLLKEGYNAQDPTKEQVAITELNTLIQQIKSFAQQIHGEPAKKYHNRLQALTADLNQLAIDLRKHHIQDINRGFSHLTQDVDALRQLA